MELELKENSPRLSRVVWSIDRLVLSDQMFFPIRLSVCLPKTCFESMDVLFEEALLDELFNVPLEGPTMDGLVPFGVVVGAIFLRSEK